MKNRFTLKRALTLNFIMVAVLPLALIGMLGLQIFFRTIEQEISTRNGQIARALAGEIDRFIDEPLRMLEIVNDRAELVRKEGKLPPPDNFLRLLQGRYGVFEQIAMVTSQGQILHLSPVQQELINIDLSGHPFFQEALTLGHPVFSETFSSPKTGMPTIAVVVPGKDMVVAGYLSLAALQQITDKIIVGTEGYVVVADRMGTIIAHPEERFVAERMNIRNLEPVRRAITGEVGTFPYEFEGIKKIGSTAITGRTGWVVMLCQPVKEAFAPVAKIKMMLLAGLAVTLLLALSLAVVVLKRPFRSLSGLTGAARKISTGDYRLEAVPPGYPEIDILVGAFKEMVQEIANREDALFKSEKKYRAFVEGSFDGIFLQKGGKIVFANQRLLEMVGCREEELIGKETWGIYAPEYQEFTRERALARLRGEDVPSQCELKMQRRDGSIFPVEISARVVMVEGEQGIQVWVNDLSERKRIEEERKTSERRFAGLYDSVSDFIFTQDLEGRFLSCNRSMLDAFGYTRDEFIGKKAADLLKPELAPLFETEYMQKLKQQGRQRGVAGYFTKRNGRIYLEYCDDLITPENGEPFVSGIARDVTERILSERALKEREQSIFAVLQASPNPIAAYDAEGNVRFMNRAFTAVFGWTLEELSGRKVDFLPDEEKQKTVENIKDLYEKGDQHPMTMETKRFTKDGRILDILTSAALIFDSRGKPAGMVVSSTDITQMKKLEAGFIHAQKMEAIGVLAGGIAHDFNNLLMGIQGNVSLVLLKEELNGNIRRNIENIESLVSRGAGLTRQLLGFARGGKYEVKVHDLNAIIEDEAALFGETKKEIAIVTAPAPDLWTVEADRSQMEQMLMNLFVNAGQAMPGGGHLDIATENVVIDEKFVRPYYINQGRYVRVSVTDTGMGMDADTKKRIFEPFFTTKGAGKGTGLGLASAYGIIKNHGGFINVYSEKDKGSSFHIYLPASDEKKGKDEDVPETSRGVIKGEGTILLVDDEETIRDVGREMLEEMGYTVVTASGGAEAIEKFTAVKNGTGEVAGIDMVIQDMIMPVVGGGEVFDRLKEIDPKVTVLLSSGYSMNGQAREILARGCRGFIQKPFTMEELSRKVQEMLG